jgi:hypothetical protein
MAQPAGDCGPGTAAGLQVTGETLDVGTACLGQAQVVLAARTGLDGQVNYILVMRNEREDLVAIGPVSIEYQAAMIRDELEESAGWTAVGIARVLTEEQARTLAAATGG